NPDNFHENRRSGPRAYLASDDEGHASHYAICTCEFRKNRLGVFGFRRPGGPASQGTAARQCDRSESQSDTWIDQRGGRPACRQRLSEPCRVLPGSPGSYRCFDPPRKIRHHANFPRARRDDGESVCRTFASRTATTRTAIEARGKTSRIAL